MAKAKTILVYSRTGGGKTTLGGELAEHVRLTTGKNTRVYNSDKGGFASVQHLIDEGVMTVIDQENTDPWIFMNKAAQGQIRKDGKWVLDPAENAKIGLYIFESMTSFSDAFMNDLAAKSAQGISFGGQANVNFSATGDGESLKIGGSNMAHYNITQTRITNEVWASQKLDAQYILWTASVSKDEDNVSSNKVLGPSIAGKALTAEIPKWFNYTFRLDVIPAQQGKPERHVMYLGPSTDVQAGNAMSLGNVRRPLAAKALPPTIEPASLVTALALIEEGGSQAREALKQRLAVAARSNV